MIVVVIILRPSMGGTAIAGPVMPGGEAVDVQLADKDGGKGEACNEAESDWWVLGGFLLPFGLPGVSRPIHAK